MNSFLYVAVVLAVVGVSSGQYNATCRGTVGAGMITPAHFFDVDKMMGTWYIHSTWMGDASEVKEPEGRCHDVVLVREETLVIGATEHYFNITDGEDKTVVSELRIDTTLPLQSTWGSFLNDAKVQDIVWVQTTYDDWAISYGCQMYADNFRSEMMVLWVRNPQRKLDEHTFEILKVIAKGYGFLPEHILPIDNSSC